MKAYRAAAIARGTPAGTPRWLVVAVVLAVAVVIAVIGSLVGASGSGTLWIAVLGAVAFGVVGAAGGVLAPSPWRRWALLDRFARANGMAVTPRADGSVEHGMIFAVTRGSRAS